ncbi:MAG: DnaA regulatory inactivator Hda [Pseudomonadales bacterium]|nr:DnaA regulatory inactivator Hda [Pseudomonadales bacterium]
MNRPPRQEVLGVSLRDEYSFDDYFSGVNEPAVFNLKQWVLAEGNWFLYLNGQKSSGKSHLLQAACRELEITQRSFIYLPLSELSDLSPDVLEGLEKINFVCIDDIEKIAGDEIWEEALFHLYNRLLDNGGRLLVAANAPPSEIDFSIADLRSRLNAAVRYTLQSASDEEKKQILKLRANSRGFLLGDEVLHYIIGRANRETKALIDVLDQLDKSSLESKRKITVPFVRSVMGW